MKFISPKNDVAFKKIFGSNARKMAAKMKGKGFDLADLTGLDISEVEGL